jgi:hypothetical protein
LFLLSHAGDGVADLKHQGIPTGKRREALLVIHGSSPRTAQVSVLSALVAGLLAGCSDYSSLRYESYPKDLRYPLRGDLLVSPRDQIPPPPENRFSLPGQLEEGIKKAAEQPGARTFDPKNLTPADRKDLTDALQTVFGTPHAPRVGPEEDSDEDAVYKQWQQQQMATLGLENASAIDNLELDPAILARGSKLYRRHCLHCHGLAGDGRGPTGPWVHPLRAVQVPLHPRRRPAQAAPRRPAAHRPQRD